MKILPNSDSISNTTSQNLTKLKNLLSRPAALAVSATTANFSTLSLDVQNVESGCIVYVMTSGRNAQLVSTQERAKVKKMVNIIVLSAKEIKNLDFPFKF